MTTKATLMLVAAALSPLPLFAQQPADAAVTAVQAPSAASVRAKALGPLALVPADAEAAVIITHLSTRFPGTELDQCPVDTVAFALGKGTGDSLGNTFKMIHHGIAEEVQKALLREWIRCVRPEYVAPIENSVNQDVDKEAFAKAVANIKVHPVYLYLSASPGKEAQFQEFVDQAIHSLKRDSEGNANISYEENGPAVHFTIKGEATGYHGRDWQSSILQQEIAGRTLHLTIMPEAGKVLVIACEDPSEVQLAQSPEQSILGTQTWSAVDANLADDIILAASCAPELENGAWELYRGYVQLFAPLTTAFGNLEGLSKTTASPLQAALFAEAAKGADAVLKQFAASIPTVQKPSFVQLWKSGAGFHLEMSGDSNGMSYGSAKLMHAEKATDTGTILYVESTPIVYTGAPVEQYVTPQNILALANGFRATLNEKKQTEITEMLMEAAPVLPLLQKSACSLCTVMSGLGSGTAAIVVDNKATTPAWISQEIGGKAILPRVAVYSGVSDRSKLAAGWDMLLDAAGDAMEMAGQDPSMIAMLPIVPTTVGDATSYTVALPVFTKDMCPNVTVSDTAFAVGTSANLNQELVTSTGTQEFAGAVFSLRFKPVADMLTSWGEVSCDRDLKQAAYIMGETAKYVESINGSSTIKEGVHTLRINVNFQK